MKKHFCENCADTTEIVDDRDYYFANNPAYPFVTYARHIHSGKVTPNACFDTQEKAEKYILDMKARCSSHENFILINKTI